ITKCWCAWVFPWETGWLVDCSARSTDRDDIGPCFPPLFIFHQTKRCLKASVTPVVLFSASERGWSLSTDLRPPLLHSRLMTQHRSEHSLPMAPHEKIAFANAVTSAVKAVWVL